MTEDDAVGAGGTSDLGGDSSVRGQHEMSPLNIKEADTTNVSCWQHGQGITAILLVLVIKSLAVTIILIVFIYYGERQIPPKGLVVSDHAVCSRAGRDMLHKDGTSVDAVIAASLCLAVVHPHRSGLGGGGVMLLHEHKKDASVVIDYLEGSPSGLVSSKVAEGVSRDMVGTLVGVPGVIKGFILAHKEYGRVAWHALFQPAIKLAEHGFTADAELVNALKRSPDMADKIFSNTPEGRSISVGSVLTRPDLLGLLKKLAHSGPELFYSDNVAKKMINKVISAGGELRRSDLFKYSPKFRDVTTSVYEGYKVITAPPPSVGAQIIASLNVLTKVSKEGMSKQQLNNLIVQAYLSTHNNMSLLGDPDVRASHDNISEIFHTMISDQQASALSRLLKNSTGIAAAGTPSSHTLPFSPRFTSSRVISYDDDGLIATSLNSLGSEFGSQLVTDDGVILNDAMRSFALPSRDGKPNPNNLVAGDKRPLSPLAPTILISPGGKCQARLAIAAGDGLESLTSIISLVADYSRLPGGDVSSLLQSPHLHIYFSSHNATVDYEDKYADFDLPSLPGLLFNKLSSRLGVTHVGERYNNTLKGFSDSERLASSAASMLGIITSR